MFHPDTQSEAKSLIAFQMFRLNIYVDQEDGEMKSLMLSAMSISDETRDLCRPRVHSEDIRYRACTVRISDIRL